MPLKWPNRMSAALVESDHKKVSNVTPRPNRTKLFAWAPGTTSLGRRDVNIAAMHVPLRARATFAKTGAYAPQPESAVDARTVTDVIFEMTDLTASCRDRNFRMSTAVDAMPIAFAGKIKLAIETRG